MELAGHPLDSEDLCLWVRDTRYPYSFWLSRFKKDLEFVNFRWNETCSSRWRCDHLWPGLFRPHCSMVSLMQCGVCFLSSGSWLYKASYRWFAQYLRQTRWAFDHKSCETSPVGQRYAVNLAVVIVCLRWNWLQLFISVLTHIMLKCPSMILPGHVWWTTGPIYVDRGRSFILHLSSLRMCGDPCNCHHWTDSF